MEVTDLIDLSGERRQIQIVLCEEMGPKPQTHLLCRMFMTFLV